MNKDNLINDIEPYLLYSGNLLKNPLEAWRITTKGVLIKFNKK